jgi:TonB family protein
MLAASAVALPAKTDAPTASATRVSTGIIAPEMIDPSSFHLPENLLGRTGKGEAQVVLSLNVDQQGQAHVMKIVKSANPELDNRIVTAVQQSRFHPATLNHQAITMGMDLTVVVKHDSTLQSK